MSHFCDKKKVHGSRQAANDLLRPLEPGPQLGDKYRLLQPKYEPSLVLPKLPFPNRSNEYTRFRPIGRSVESAFWDNVLPKLNEKWKREKEAAAN